MGPPEPGVWVCQRPGGHSYGFPIRGKHQSIPRKVYGMTALKPVSNTPELSHVANSSAGVKMQDGGEKMQGGVNRILKGENSWIPEDGVSNFPQGGVIVLSPGWVCFSQEKWLLLYQGISWHRDPSSHSPTSSSMPPMLDPPRATLVHTTLPGPPFSGAQDEWL